MFTIGGKGSAGGEQAGSPFARRCFFEVAHSVRLKSRAPNVPLFRERLSEGQFEWISHAKIVCIVTSCSQSRLGRSRLLAAKNWCVFFLIVIDEDKKVFNVVGPMTDDRGWNKKIVELQKSGRHVRCVSNTNHCTVPALAALYSRHTGLTHSAALIVEPPIDESFEYLGALPRYAEHADRKRLVKLLCKGDCNTTRWAEMTVAYPGQEVLTGSQVLDFTAICLKCGREAEDPYNWYR